MYKEVVERLLVALSEEQEAEKQRTSSPDFITQEPTTWPPWPWPPWGGDDDGDDGGDGDRDNRTMDAHKLAKKVVKFERKLAKASLDL